MKTVAVIQARMSSTRFPGKVLVDLVGKPLLFHLIHRLRKSQYISEIIIATSDQDSDNPLEVFAQSEDITCVRGPLNNVLKRFEMAYQKTGPDYLVRITGDAPLVDPETIDQMIACLNREGADRIDNGGVASIHSGFEVVSGNLFEQLTELYGDDPFAREHVTGVLGRHPGLGKTVKFEIDPEHLIEGARTSVDTPDDLTFMQRIHEELGADAGEINLKKLVHLLKSTPELLELNAHIRQKSAVEETKTVLFITEAGGGAGMGHLSRTLALADRCRTQFSHGIIIACRGEIGCTAARNMGFLALNLDKGREVQTIENTITTNQIHAVVLDVRNFLTLQEIESIKGKHPVVFASIDDGSDRRLACELSFLPPTPQALSLSWPEGTSAHIGWDWIIVPPTKVTGPLTARSQQQSGKLRLLVTMGGSDPFNLTGHFVQVLANTNANIDIDILIGPGFSHSRELRKLAANTLPDARIIDPVENIGHLIAGTDALLTAYGVTVFEAATMGKPSLFVTHSEDDSIAASAFETAGGGVCLGSHQSLDENTIAKKLKATFTSRSIIKKMGAKAGQLIDGKGVERIARIIDEAEC